jgi:archaellum biogenesis ATPase FlaH
MAADHEVRLFSKVIRDRNILPLIEAGVQPNWFRNDDVREAYRWVMQHWMRYKEVPTATSTKFEHAQVPLLRVDDSLEYLLDKFIEFRRAVKIEDAVQDAIEAVQDRNFDAALKVMEDRVSEIYRETQVGTSDLHLHKDPDARYEAYLSMENLAHSLLGLPTGFEKIDEATAGLQGGQLITVIAPPKTGKSMILLQTAINVHEDGHNVLFQSFEMSNTEQQTRHDAMRSGVSHNRMRRRTLTQSEKVLYQRTMAKMATMPNTFTMTDAVQGITVTALAAKIDQVKPDVAFIDGVYLMQDEQTGESNTPQALTNITRSLKRLAQRMDIPIVISTQTLLWKMKGNKVSADSIGYSSSFFQDSDVILGLEPIDNEPELRTLKIVASRNCGPDEVELIWRWETGCFHDESLGTNCSGCKLASRWTPTVPVT